MTRDEAVRMVQAFFQSHSLQSPGLNDQNLGGAAVGEFQIYFEYQPSNHTLKCSALVYRFHAAPKPGVLEAFKAAQSEFDSGGGWIDFEPENKGLYLSRSYSQQVPHEQFAKELDSLMNAGKLYGDQVLDRVAAKASAADERG
jgi:hypothetical protein